MFSAQTYGTVVSVSGAAVSAACAVLAWLLSRRSLRGHAHEQVNQRYDKLMDFRGEHPEVLALGYQWTDDCYTEMYGGNGVRSRQWVLYYTYVEFVIGFCNAVEYARRRGALDSYGYRSHYRPLMRLLLTEHAPIVNGMVKSGLYISSLVREFWCELESAEHWDWPAEHLALTRTSSSLST